MPVYSTETPRDALVTQLHLGNTLRTLIPNCACERGSSPCSVGHKRERESLCVCVCNVHVCVNVFECVCV